MIEVFKMGLSLYSTDRGQMTEVEWLLSPLMFYLPSFSVSAQAEGQPADRLGLQWPDLTHSHNLQRTVFNPEYPISSQSNVK